MLRLFVALPVSFLCANPAFLSSLQPFALCKQAHAASVVDSISTCMYECGLISFGATLNAAWRSRFASLRKCKSVNWSGSSGNNKKRRHTYEYSSVMTAVTTTLITTTDSIVKIIFHINTLLRRADTGSWISANTYYTYTDTYTACIYTYIHPHIHTYSNTYVVAMVASNEKLY